jgi:hypothetical protein
MTRPKSFIGASEKALGFINFQWGTSTWTKSRQIVHLPIGERCWKKAGFTYDWTEFVKDWLTSQGRGSNIGERAGRNLSDSS